METRDEEGPGGIQGTQVGSHCLSPARLSSANQSRAARCRELARQVQELVGAMLSDLRGGATPRFSVCTNDGGEFLERGSSGGGPPALLGQIMSGLGHAEFTVLLRHLAGEVTSIIGY